MLLGVRVRCNAKSSVPTNDSFRSLFGDRLSWHCEKNQLPTRVNTTNNNNSKNNNNSNNERTR